MPRCLPIAEDWLYVFIPRFTPKEIYEKYYVEL